MLFCQIFSCCVKIWAKMSSKKTLKEYVSHFIRIGQYIHKFIKHKIRSFNSFLYIRLLILNGSKNTEGILKSLGRCIILTIDKNFILQIAAHHIYIFINTQNFVQCPKLTLSKQKCNVQKVQCRKITFIMFKYDSFGIFSQQIKHLKLYSDSFE